MAKVPGLARKKNAYFYCRRVPLELRPLFGNRQQIWIPLLTSDLRVAGARARAKAIEVDRQFDDARLGIPPADKVPSGLATVAQLENAVRIHLFEMERAEDSATPGPDDQRHALELLMHLEGPEEDWGGTVHEKALSLAARFQLRIGPGDRHWSEFARLIHRAEMEHARRCLDRANKAFGAASHDILFGDVHARKTAPKLLDAGGATVDDVIKRFDSDPTRADLTESARKKYIIPFLALREIAGDRMAVKEINRTHCAEMIETIAALPANYTKYKEFEDKSLREIVEINRTAGRKRLASGTVGVYAHHLSAFFNYAVQKGICETNPATRLVPKGVKTTGSRVPFDAAEIGRLVSELPKWCGATQGGRYWLPLIALFSGMRLGEIIWLKRNDIRTVDGVQVFVLEREEDRSLKTEGAARVVPIHPTLVKLGFLTCVERLRPTQRLFADLPGDDQKKAVDLFQKRFSYWLEKRVKVRDGVSFHSFRHAFRDATRNAGIPIDVIRALGGWARGSAIEERYGQGARPSVLAQWLEKIAYPGIDFATLESVTPGAKSAT